MPRNGDRKHGVSGFGAVVSAVVRTAMRRSRPAAPAAAPSRASAPEPRDPGRPLDVAEERAASRDLLAIDSLVRRYYALASGVGAPDQWSPLRALFHPGARVGTGAPDPDAETGVDDVPVDRFIQLALAIAAPSRYAERSRTVHVLGDVAVVISAFEVERGAQSRPGSGVNVFQLRLSPEGWLIQSLLVRPVERAITEKSADPRPLASRQR